MRIVVNNLGLSAFIKQHGDELISVGKTEIIFESLKPARQWQIEYANSCCAKHDAEVCNLKRLSKNI